jgi:hypothetical protein
VRRALILMLGASVAFDVACLVCCYVAERHWRAIKKETETAAREATQVSQEMTLKTCASDNRGRA